MTYLQYLGIDLKWGKMGIRQSLFYGPFVLKNVASIIKVGWKVC
jgi:hypothetical protein